MLTDTQLNELNELEKRATPGPWGMWVISKILYDSALRELPKDKCDADALLIAAIRNVSRDLIQSGIDGKKYYDDMRKFQSRYIESCQKIAEIEYEIRTTNAQFVKLSREALALEAKLTRAREIIHDEFCSSELHHPFCREMEQDGSGGAEARKAIEEISEEDGGLF